MNIIRKLLIAGFVCLAVSMNALTWTDTCFSPDHCDQKLADFISKASRSLDVAIYDLNLSNIVSVIISQSRGLSVRVVVDKRQVASDKNSLVMELVKAGVHVKYGVQKGIMHNKFSIVDETKLEIGSFNYTRNAVINNHENQFYTDDPQTANLYENEFNKIWQEGEVIKP